MALLIQVSGCVLQSLNPTWLISGMGLTLMTLSFYLTLENPEILRAELTEQKMSMMYLKSQVNPHFLYNTLDTIRIQAQLNNDKQVADLLMRLVDFFRQSVKVNQQMVALDDELDLLEAYMELMCYRYPKLVCNYEIDPDLGGVMVPNFILQPIVENSLLHGLKNKGYQGEVRITAKKSESHHGYMEVEVMDTGSGFEQDARERIQELLLHYDRQAQKLTGNSIGILNVQKRIKLLCGKECGLWYTDNASGGVKMKKLRVLLVDDEIMIREGFKKLFDWEAHDCDVVGEAADGMEALGKIDALKPDIVIMDINIPIMSGLKVIQLSRMKHPNTAFVIVSGYDDFSYCQQALRLQITDYMLKPVNYEEFGTCIDNLKISLFQQKIASEAENEKQEERVITGITRYMQEHLAEEVSLSVLAEEFHLNAQYISQLFKNEIGVGFLAYLTNIRMEKAKKLLLSTSLSVAEIAERSGYGDYRVFTKTFKKTEGITPSQYRREFLEVE